MRLGVKYWWKFEVRRDWRERCRRGAICTRTRPLLTKKLTASLPFSKIFKVITFSSFFFVNLIRFLVTINVFNFYQLIMPSPEMLQQRTNRRPPVRIGSPAQIDAVRSVVRRDPRPPSPGKTKWMMMMVLCLIRITSI